MTVGISLGWNCYPAIYGAENGIRKTKANGYNRCPFDEMITNYNGVLKCIDEDFQDFYNLDYIDIKQISAKSKYCANDFLIYNKKYNFIFNHESPGHANLWYHQKWAGGMNHYVDNNYKLFVERYKRRVDNFRNYLQSGEEIIFLLSAPSDDDDFYELRTILNKKYPNLKYSIHYIELQIEYCNYQKYMDLL